MKQDIKICLPLYKLVYSVMFLIILSLVRGISTVFEIGGALDSNIALLAIVFCAETYVMEKSGGRGEIFRLFPVKNRVKAVRRRLLIQNLYLYLLSYIGFFFFFWQRPQNMIGISFWYEYGTYMLAVTGTILFWSTLSMTISNLFGNQWGGIAVSLIIWMVVNSMYGQDVLGKFNIFAYGFRNVMEVHDVSWMFGKLAGALSAMLMIGLIPYIMKKRG